MIENEIVVLAIDLPESGLRIGDIGTIVMCHNNGLGYEVEFVKFNGETISVETLSGSQIRPVANDEIPHVRLVRVA